MSEWTARPATRPVEWPHGESTRRGASVHSVRRGARGGGRLAGASRPPPVPVPPPLPLQALPKLLSPKFSHFWQKIEVVTGTVTPPLTTESPTTHYCTVQHHVPINPYAERMPRADCSSNTIRDSISRVAPSLRGPRFAPALRHARRPCALPSAALARREDARQRAAALVDG